MRILWASNAPWVGSGYGVQTAQVVRRLARDGHKVAISSNYGLAGQPMSWEGVPVFGVGLDAYGNDVIPPIYDRWKAMGGGEPTLLITLFDVWVFKNPAFDAIPVAAWTPVDHFPVPPEVANWSRKHTPIAMSRFGQQALEAAGMTAHYVPHAVETGIFKPTPSRIREQMGIPADAFLIMVNAANKGNIPPRKAWGEMLTAFSVFLRQHPDAYLYLHTDLDGHNGVPLIVLLTSLGLGNDRVKHAPQAALRLGEIPDTALAELYSAADVLLSTSFGEGFGVPVIEAQACGTPVIVNSVTAQPELCGAGWQVANQPYWDFTQGAWYGIPLVGSIVEQLNAAYAAKGDQDLRRKAVAFAAGYDAETVYQRDWKPLLRTLEAQIAPPSSRQQRRQAQRKQRKAA